MFFYFVIIWKHRALYTNNIKKCEKKVFCRFFIGELFLLGNLSRKHFKL
jgi:hypothetical protein